MRNAQEERKPRVVGQESHDSDGKNELPTDNLHTDLLSSLVYCVGEFLSFSFFFALVLPLLLDNLD
jgi:hypothetical protein